VLKKHREATLTFFLQHSNRQTAMPLVGFEPTISVGERPQTYALDRAATRTGNPCSLQAENPKRVHNTNVPVPKQLKYL
jgi:hypothetical protein